MKQSKWICCTHNDVQAYNLTLRFQREFEVQHPAKAFAEWQEWHGTVDTDELFEIRPNFSK
jgi:hypothetical protein